MAHRGISVRQIAASEGAAWDELVLSSRQGDVIHLYEFLSTWVDTDPSLYLVRLGCYNESNQLVGGQAIIHEKVLGMRIQNVLSIFYPSTPILLRAIQEQVCERYDVLTALAKESMKYYYPSLNLRAEFDPSLNDARPYLEQGWRVSPRYTHIWDISDPEAVWMSMPRNRRQYIRSAQKHLLFACEEGDAILDDFARLYRENMNKFNWTPERSWKGTFKKRVAWMRSRDYFRMYTCRRTDGQLVGMIAYILSRINQTAYAWLIAYDHSAVDKEFYPAFNWFAAKDLSSEFHYYDAGPTSQPSLYQAKDLLGTSSVLHWVVSARTTKRWIRVYNWLKDIKQSLRKILL